MVIAGEPAACRVSRVDLPDQSSLLKMLVRTARSVNFITRYGQCAVGGAGFGDRVKAVLQALPKCCGVGVAWAAHVVGLEFKPVGTSFGFFRAIPPYKSVAIKQFVRLRSGIRAIVHQR